VSKFLSSMTLVVLGAIGGFGIFHSALQYRIEQIEQNYNTTLASITSRFSDSERERKRCSETDGGRLQEISDLRGRLDAQHMSWHDLTVAQRSIVSKQQENAAQTQRYQQVYEQDQQALESLKAEAEEKDRRLVALREDIQQYHLAKVELESALKTLENDSLEATRNFQIQIQNKDEENSAQIQQFRETHERDQQALDDLKVESVLQDRYLTSIRKDLQRENEMKAQLETDIKNLKEVNKEETNNLKVQMHHKDLEIESLRKNLGLLSKQKAELENGNQELQMWTRQKDEEIESVKRNSDTLQIQNMHLEDGVTEMKIKIEIMESQILDKDKELSKFREEEGNLEKKLVNFREGMLDLLKEKIQEIHDLEEHVNSVNEEKADLELRLDNWREGMLTLVKEKIQAIDQLEAELAESKERMNTMMHEVEQARSEHVEAEEFVRDQLDVIDQNSDPEQKEIVQNLMQEVEHVRSELEESQQWVVAAMEEIECLKSDQAKSETLIAEKTSEIQDLKLQIEREQESAKEIISKLVSDLEEAQLSVKVKTSQIEQLNSELGGFVLEINDLKTGLTRASFESINFINSTVSEQIIHHIQQRDSVMCRQLFGKGPYYVKFVVRIPSTEPTKSGDDFGNEHHNNTAFFVIELSFRKELPHSTYTFLTLVESNLYNDGAAFLSARDGGGLKIGSRHSRDANSLERKQTPLGLTDESSISFVETSTSGEPLPCGEFTFGFGHRGPGLNLFIDGKDKDEKNSDTDCFAHVIRGQENLHKIQSLLLESGEPLEILSAKHLRVD